MIHPMLITRTWRFDPLNIELQNWLFQGKACANCKAFVKPIFWGNGQNWYTLCYSQEHEGVIHSILNFKFGYFKGKPLPTASLLWSWFPDAVGKNNPPYVTHKNLKVWSTQYWTSKLVISSESLGQLQGFFWSRFPEAMGKNDTPCYSQEIEGVIHWILNFKIGYFKRKPWPTARLFWSWSPEAMGKNDTPYVTHKNMKVWSTQYWTSKLVISRESLGRLQGFYEADFLRQ